jgi:hypothetical protein
VNCDGRISAADLPELTRLIPDGDVGHCFAGDVDQNGVVDDLDLPALVNAIFGGTR